MPVRLILLRLLLCVALLLNGTASAMAAARMAIPAAEPQGMAMQSAAPCHDMATMDHAAEPAQASQGSDPAPDCCTSGICQCTCVHAAQIALPFVLAPAFDARGARIALSMPAGHAQPALPHPIRPPIG